MRGWRKEEPNDSEDECNLRATNEQISEHAVFSEQSELYIFENSFEGSFSTTYAFFVRYICFSFILWTQRKTLIIAHLYYY